MRGLRASLRGANPLNSDQFCQQTYLGGSRDRWNNRCMLHTFVRLFLYTQADRVCDLGALTCMWPLGEPRRCFTAKQEAQKLVVVAGEVNHWFCDSTKWPLSYLPSARHC